MKEKIKTASIFSGCGGSDLGLHGRFDFNNRKYTPLPFEIVFALDNDPKAVTTYNRNFNRAAIAESIEEYDIRKMPDFDLLVGGFPCQSFSTVNPTKNPFDDRAKLYKQMAKILKIKQPAFFIAENVKGLVLLNKGAILAKVMKEFEKQGYDVVYKILNAADYGVPQKRERVFMVGSRKDLHFDFVFPDGTHSQFGAENDSKRKWVALKEIIKKVEDADKKYYFSKKAVEGMKKAKNNMKRGLAQDLDGPSLTLTSHLAKVSLNSRDPVLLIDPQKELYRRFTPREAASIQSFPENFEFSGSEADAYRQIGNAIPPVLMWHIAAALAKQSRAL